MDNLPIVPAANIAAMFCSALLCVLLPIVIMIVLRKRNGTKISYFFIGCAAFFLFALILEQIIHTVVLKSPVGDSVLNNIWLYGLYGGLMAGLFEETARLFAFKTLMRKSDRLSDSLMYGAGHGGIEAILIAGVQIAEYAVFCIMSNMGLLSQIFDELGETLGTQSEEYTTAVDQLGAVVTQYANGGVLMPALGFVERVSAVMLHIALSVLVYIAAKRKGKGWLYPLAIFLHAAVDFGAAVMSKYVSSFEAIEAALFVCSVAIAVLAGIIYSRTKKADEAAAVEAVSEEAAAVETPAKEAEVIAAPTYGVSEEDAPVEKAAAEETETAVTPADEPTAAE